MISFLDYLKSKLITESVISGTGNWPVVTLEKVESYKTRYPLVYEGLRFFMDMEIESDGTQVPVTGFKLPNNPVKNEIKIDKQNKAEIIEIYVGVDVPPRSQRADRANAMNFVIDQFKKGPVQSKANKNIYFYYGDMSKAVSNFPKNSKAELYIGTAKAVNAYKDDVVTAHVKLSSVSLCIGIYELVDSQYVLRAIAKFRMEVMSDKSNENSKMKAKIKTASSILEKSLHDGNYEITFKNRKEMAKIFRDTALEKLGGDERDPEFVVYEEIFNMANSSSDSFEFSDRAKKYILESNFGNVVSEILPPMLLINNIHTFSNIKDLIFEITGNKNFVIDRIEWPESSVNGFSDYNLFFANGTNMKSKERKKFAISAKCGDGHPMPFVPLVLSHIDELKKELKKVNSPMVSNIVNSLDSEKEFIKSKGNILFGTWVAGYCVLFNKEMDSDDMKNLKELWTAVNDREFVDLTKLKAYGTIKKKLENAGIIKMNAFPYSFTNASEKLVVRHSEFAPDSFIAGKARTWLTGEGEDFTQIKLKEERTHGYKVIISKPEATTSKIKFVTNLGDGSVNFAHLSPMKPEDKKSLIKSVLRGTGQAIGIKIK